MKKFRTIVLFLGIIAFIPATSYAIFDIGVYGGYSFAGEIQNDQLSENPEPKGITYGVIGHYNQPIFPLLRMGIGLYSQYSDLTYDISSDEVEFKKKILGIDLYLQLDFPLFPLHPYVKFQSAIWEENQLTGEISSTNYDETNKEYFSTYTTGIGAALTFFPFVQFFAEYQYNYAKSVGNDVAVGHGIAAGLRLFL